MQLPQHLQRFPTSSLLITSDSIIAKLFFIGGDSLEEVSAISEPRENKQDNEGYFCSSDEARHGGPASDPNESERLNKFIKKLLTEIRQLTLKNKIDHLFLVMPAEIEHLISQELNQEENKKIKKILHLDLMKYNPLEIVERLLNT